MSEETGWICPECGRRLTESDTASEATSESKAASAKRRVGEDEVARILSLVANPPNLRENPTEGDLVGDYHAWFDGGAMRIDTGTKVYSLADGTRIVVVAPVLWLEVEITFPNGDAVVVRQVRGERTV